MIAVEGEQIAEEEVELRRREGVVAAGDAVKPGFNSGTGTGIGNWPDGTVAAGRGISPVGCGGSAIVGGLRDSNAHYSHIVMRTRA